MFTKIGLILGSVCLVLSAFAVEPTPKSETKEKIEKIHGGALKVEKKSVIPLTPSTPSTPPPTAATPAPEAIPAAAEAPATAPSSEKEKPESAGHLFGLHAAVGVPHPISYGLNYIHSSRMFSVELNMGSFGGSSSDVKFNLTNTEIGLRWHPFAGTLFVGALYGNQTVTAEKTEAINLFGNVTGKATVKANYLTPIVGWLWGMNGGFFASFEVGYQTPSSVTVDFTSDAPTLAQATNDYKTLESDVRKQGKDLGEISLPHLILLKVGYTF